MGFSFVEHLAHCELLAHQFSIRLLRVVTFRDLNEPMTCRKREYAYLGRHLPRISGVLVPEILSAEGVIPFVSVASVDALHQGSSIGNLVGERFAEQ